jgi:hypothetical protein
MPYSNIILTIILTIILAIIIHVYSLITIFTIPAGADKP